MAPPMPPVNVPPGSMSWSQRTCAANTMTAVLDVYAARTNSRQQRPPEPSFNDRHLWLWLTLIPTLLSMGFFYAHDVWWRATIRARARRKQEEQEVDSLASTLVKKLSPSLAVEGYRFRGMRKKNATVSLAFQDLGLTLKNGSSVLDGVTGKFEAGQLVAIMGPSGAGKTTFMNVLCGKATYGRMTGHVYINGEEKPIQDLKPVTGFVPQDDVVHETLTVREQLRYSSELRSQFGTPSNVHTAVVDDVLQVMQVDHIQESIVGGVESRGISGGQRKRVNIGLELAACPVLLFLDEPTSGLDATSSLMIIGSLKKMTQLGMTIIMVIHQPRYSLFTLFDEVLLLGKGGRTVYLGDSLGAVNYFEKLGFERPRSDNPADWLMDVISGAVSSTKFPKHEPQLLFDKWVEQGSAKDEEAPAGESGSPSLRAPSFRPTDDKKVIAEMIENEWQKVDVERTTVLDLKGLRHVLTNCLGSEPGAELVEKLAKQISPEEKNGVRRSDFVSYFMDTCDLVKNQRQDDHADGEMMHVMSQLGQAADRILASGFTTEGMNDLHRVTPGWFKQYRVMCHRTLVQFWRHSRRRAIDNGLIILCAVIGGVMHQGGTQEPPNIMVFHLGLALLITVSCLKTFADRPLFWRESGSGINVFSFFTARLTLDTYDVWLQTVLYVSVYYLIAQPKVAFGSYLVPCLMISVAASGWGYLLSTLIVPSNAVTAGVVTMLVLCGVLGNPTFLSSAIDGGFKEVVTMVSVMRWSMQMFLMRFHEEMGGLRYPLPPADCETQSMEERLVQAETKFSEVGSVKYVEEVEQAFRRGFLIPAFGYWGSGIFALALQGLLLRVCGYLALRFRNRDKQV